jgi:hypothetical protein
VTAYASCDVSTPFIISDNKSLTVSTECGSIIVYGASMFHEHIFCELDGSFTLKFDSLNIGIIPNTVEIINLTYYYNDKLVTDLKETINASRNDKLSIRFDYKSDTNIDKKSVTVLLLPSDFISCNNMSIIKDTVQIKIKN